MDHSQIVLANEQVEPAPNAKRISFDAPNMLKPMKNKSCKNALSVWCQVDTNIIFLMILNNYWIFLLKTTAN